MTLYDVRSQEHAWLLSFLSVEKPSMFLAYNVIKRHFGARTQSQESSKLSVAKKVLGLCLAKRRLMSLCSLFIFYHFQVYGRKLKAFEKKEDDLL